MRVRHITGVIQEMTPEELRTLAPILGDMRVEMDLGDGKLRWVRASHFSPVSVTVGDAGDGTPIIDITT